MVTTRTDWTLEELLDYKPELVEIAETAKEWAKDNKDTAYLAAKNAAADFVGWESLDRNTASNTAYELWLSYLCEVIGY